MTMPAEAVVPSALVYVITEAAHLSLGAAQADIAHKQLASTTIVSYSPTYIHLAVAGNPELISASDGPLDPIGYVLDDEGETVGGVLVWIEGGLLSMLEQFWITDDPPVRWPDRGHVVVEFHESTSE